MNRLSRGKDSSGNISLINSKLRTKRSRKIGMMIRRNSNKKRKNSMIKLVILDSV